MTSLLAYSTNLYLGVNAFARSTPWLHGAATAYAEFGIVLFAVLLIVGAWSTRRDTDRRLAAAVWAGVGTLVALGLNQIVASMVAEARPYAAHPSALVLVSRTTDWSFPSDHSVMAGACVVGLLLYSRRLGAITAVAAVLMGATRVYVGAHYPHDVVAGLVFGGLVVWVGWLVLGRPLEVLVGRARRLPVASKILAPAQ